MKTIYQVRSSDGINFNVEASSYTEAKLRATSPIIARHIALMITQALSNINSIEPSRGPKHLVKGPLFTDEFFNK
jgi:hypothetical protein